MRAAGPQSDSPERFFYALGLDGMVPASEMVHRFLPLFFQQLVAAAATAESLFAWAETFAEAGMDLTPVWEDPMVISVVGSRDD